MFDKLSIWVVILTEEGSQEPQYRWSPDILMVLNKLFWGIVITGGVSVKVGVGENIEPGVPVMVSVGMIVGEGPR